MVKLRLQPILDRPEGAKVDDESVFIPSAALERERKASGVTMDPSAMPRVSPPPVRTGQVVICLLDGVGHGPVNAGINHKSQTRLDRSGKRSQAAAPSGDLDEP